MSTDLESVPLEELIAKARRNALEKTLVPLATILTALVGIFIWYQAFYWITLPWPITAWLACAGAFGIAGQVTPRAQQLATKRNREFSEELDCRLGRMFPHGELNLLEGRQPGETICVFKSHGPPVGRGYFGVIRISAAQEAVLRVLAGRRGRRGLARDRVPEQFERQLSPKETAGLLEKLEQVKGKSDGICCPGMLPSHFSSELSVAFGDESRVLRYGYPLAFIAHVPQMTETGESHEEILRITELIEHVAAIIHKEAGDAHHPSTT